jgi:hypothetical protein
LVGWLVGLKFNLSLLQKEDTSKYFLFYLLGLHTLFPFLKTQIINVMERISKIIPPMFVSIVESREHTTHNRREDTKHKEEEKD